MQQHDGNNPVERAVGIGDDAGEGGHQQPPPGLCGQPAYLSGTVLPRVIILGTDT